MIDRTHALPIARQAVALGISRGAVYYTPRPPSALDLTLMREIDTLHLEFPFAGAHMLRRLLRHVAQEDHDRVQVLDQRTLRHPGYAVSQVRRKPVEEAYGWGKTVGGLRKLRHRGREQVDWIFTFAVAVYDLVRIRTLIRVGVCPPNARPAPARTTSPPRARPAQAHPAAAAPLHEHRNNKTLASLEMSASCQTCFRRN